MQMQQVYKQWNNENKWQLKYIRLYIIMVVISCYLEKSNEKFWKFFNNYLLWNEHLPLLSAAL